MSNLIGRKVRWTNLDRESEDGTIVSVTPCEYYSEITVSWSNSNQVKHKVWADDDDLEKALHDAATDSQARVDYYGNIILDEDFTVYREWVLARAATLKTLTQKLKKQLRDIVPIMQEAKDFDITIQLINAASSEIEAMGWSSSSMICALNS